jgi:ACR3 family arsenite efflux pump ArsB
MWRFLSKIKEKLSLSILLSMAAGLTVGYFVNTSWLNNLIIPLTILMVFPMMVNLDFSKLFNRDNMK